MIDYSHGRAERGVLARAWARCLAALPARKRRRTLEHLSRATEPVQGMRLIRDAALGTGYAMLWELERAGLITREERPDTSGVRGGRPSFWYSITAAGRQWLESDTPAPSARAREEDQ